jgi:hypothetical protein
MGRRICFGLTRHGCGCDVSDREVGWSAKCSGNELMCGGIQSVVRALGEKWAGVAGQERGSRASGAAAQSPKAKAQLNGHKSCLVVSTSRARNSRVAKAELSPNNNNITSAREPLAREPSCLPNALSPSSSILKISYHLSPIYQASAIVRAADCCNCCDLAQSIPSPFIPPLKWSAKNPDAPSLGKKVSEVTRAACMHRVQRTPALPCWTRSCDLPLTACLQACMHAAN